MNFSSKIKALVAKAFGSGDISRDKVNYAVRCPSCGESNKSKKKLVVRLDDGRYHCWVCGIKGKNILYLIKKFRPDLVQGLNLKLKTENIEDEKVAELPKGFVNLSSYNGRDPDVLSVLSYLKNRGIKNSEIARWRIRPRNVLVYP